MLTFVVALLLIPASLLSITEHENSSKPSWSSSLFFFAFHHLPYMPLSLSLLVFLSKFSEILADLLIPHEKELDGDRSLQGS
uniref:Uncharacterized protein n=1 Tax=Rhizophora mucronata TaxID=61149 RepID=A0A2P2QYP5_RHIMU